ncbi:MAG: AAA family ATPase [Anaerolineae bacterium UTCFX2]|nr:MoxR family ATPase [Anaerolineales bacterium]OQY88805.1 MAG: AAA family ATPase [Anaerolineae bacterium UTCFX2]
MTDQPPTPEQFRQLVNDIEAEVGRVIVGQQALIRQTLITLLAGGNALLEGVPGLGKTMLVRTLSQTIDCSFSRIQFTPDLMPSDIVGTNLIVEDESGRRQFQFEAGPIFANLILADEINRATPKTQSAMLEAMQEHSVTVAKATRSLPEPFFVLATQNPLEMEGTYPLPEAQLDRFFFKIDVPFPAIAELVEIADRTTAAGSPSAGQITQGQTILEMQKLARAVPIAPHVTEFAAQLLTATHPGQPSTPQIVQDYVRYGASPRGLQAMVLAGKIFALIDGRFNVAYDDIRNASLPAMRHRLILNFDAQAEGITADQIITHLGEQISVKA